MFKKKDLKEIRLQTIVRFFDMIAEQKVFKENETNRDWLWKKLHFIIDFFNNRNHVTITQEKFLELISTDTHKTYFNQEDNENTKDNVISLDKMIQTNPILKGLSEVVSSSWVNYEDSLGKKEEKEKFSKKHVFSILNLTVISFIIVGTFYSWKMFGVIGLAVAMSYFAYKGIKKIVSAISNYREEENIKKKVEQVISNKDEQMLNIISEFGLEPWTNDQEINEELLRLKNKSIRFISLYVKNERNRHPSMVLDFNKIWQEHIPLFIKSIADNDNLENRETILKAITSMSNVIGKHIENLFWDESIDISAKQRYWLMKETEKNV